MLLCRLLRVRAVCRRRARLVMLRLLRRRRRRRGGMRMRRGRRRLGRCRRRGLGRFCIRFWCRLGRRLLLLGREGWFEDVFFFCFFGGIYWCLPMRGVVVKDVSFFFLFSFFSFFFFFLFRARDTSVGQRSESVYSNGLLTIPFSYCTHPLSFFLSLSFSEMRLSRTYSSQASWHGYSQEYQDAINRTKSHQSLGIFRTQKRITLSQCLSVSRFCSSNNLFLPAWSRFFFFFVRL